MNRHLKLLIVEDTPADAELAVYELRKAGFDLDWCRVETEEEYVKALDPGLDIILSDYTMPQFGGPWALELLKQRDLDIPFIIISGTIGEDTAVDVMKMGASDYLLKDRMGRLGQAVKHALEQRRLRAERKRAEEALGESQAKLEAALASMTDAVFISDAAGQFIEFNDAFASFHRFKNKAECARRVADYPDILEVFMANGELVPLDMWAVPRALRGETVTNAEYTLRRKDTGETWVGSYSFSPIRDKDGAIVGSVVVGRDITERKRAEETLQRLRDQSSSILNSVSEGVHGIGLDGRITFENPSAAAMLGYEIADLIGQPAHSTMHHTRCDGMPYPQSECPIYATLRDGLVRHVTDEVFWRKDGTSFPVNYTTTPLRDKDGGIIGATVVFTDNTERKRAEEELRQREDDLAEAQRIARLGSWSYDIASNKVHWSDELFRIFGIEKALFDGTHASFLKCVVPEDQPKVLQMNAETRAHGTSFDVEYRIKTQSGDLKTIREIGCGRRDAGGKVVGLVGTAQDITEHKRAFERIEEQAALINQTHDAIMVRDMEGRILFWSKGAERLYGYAGGEMLGRRTRDLIYGGNTEKYDEASAATVDRGEWSGEIEQFVKDGRKVTVQARWTLMRDEQGKPKSILAINTDITEKKEMEAQFLRAQRMESIGTLAGGIAHDLNNILAPIMMSIEMLKTKSHDALTNSVLDTLESCAQRGADIVGQVLSFGRGLEGHKVEIQPNHLLKEIKGIIKDTFPKDIELKFSPARDAWAIHGDATQLHQILLNLCVNARDAMPGGGSLTLNVENRTLYGHDVAMIPRARAGDYVVISVTDTGTGIPQNIIEKIFDPFFTTKEIGKGTGLGLSTVQGIVKSHGGFLNVYSEPGKGTTFRLYFPAITAPQAGDQQDTQASLPRGNGETVLIIDDEVSILTIASQTLEAFGYRVLTAENGAAGVAVYAQHSKEIALVLTDMMMPVMDGAATIHTLRKINPAVKAIAASGLNANENVTRATDAGIKHFIAKPYTAAALLKTLRSVLDEDLKTVST